MHVPRIALVSAVAALDLDEDLAPLQQALQARGAAVAVCCWDDPAVDWAAFDLALLRSTWDYATRLDAFVAWLERVAVLTRLLNPLELVRWNLDKRYLQVLAARDMPVIPTRFIAPGEAVELSDRAEFVLKPSVGAGSKGARRFGRGEGAAALAHVAQLHASGLTVMVQPYLSRVDRNGETALVCFGGRFSHAIRKGPLLRLAGADPAGLFAPESISARVPSAAELALAEQVLAALPGPAPAYARVDVIEDDAGQPVVLELELTEPSLFFATAPSSADRFAAVLLDAQRAD